MNSLRKKTLAFLYPRKSLLTRFQLLLVLQFALSGCNFLVDNTTLRDNIKERLDNIQSTFKDVNNPDDWETLKRNNPNTDIVNYLSMEIGYVFADVLTLEKNTGVKLITCALAGDSFNNFVVSAKQGKISEDSWIWVGAGKANSEACYMELSRLM